MRHVAAGGMGQVWVARNLATRGDVAVKLVLADAAASAETLARFRHEAHTTARLNHRAIVRVFDLIELDPEEGSLAIVMELLQGETLAARLAKYGRLALPEVLDIVLPLLSALDYAHEAGVVHRDLKPENVFLAREPDGRLMPKILDFGVSKTRSALAEPSERDGGLAGTPCYMSPEQAQIDDDVDARSDVFSMGVVLYEMLSGNNPFVRDRLYSVLRAVIAEPVPPIEGLSPAVWSVIARALAKRREDRYASAGELAAALLDAMQRELPASESRPSAPRSLAPVATTTLRSAAVEELRPPRRAWKKGLAAAAAVVTMLLFVGHGGAVPFGAPAIGKAQAEEVTSALATERAVKTLEPDVTSLRAAPVPTEEPPPPHAVRTPDAAPREPAPARVARRPVIVIRDPGF